MTTSALLALVSPLVAVIITLWGFGRTGWTLAPVAYDPPLRLAVVQLDLDPAGVHTPRHVAAPAEPL